MFVEIPSVPLVPPNPLIQSLVGDHIYALTPAVAHYLIWAVILLQKLSSKRLFLLFEPAWKLAIPPSELCSLLGNGWFVVTVTGVAITVYLPRDC